MIKFITIGILIFTNVIVNAQTKPSKQETIDFINRTCELNVGRKSTLGGTITIVKCSFLYDKYIYNTNWSVPQEGFRNREYSNIKWENLDTVFHSKGVSRFGDDIISINILFTSKCKYVMDSNISDSETDYYNEIEILIPESKYESVWKAFLRLSEIAREESKDPFQD